MSSIQLIVTGELELLALSEVLGRVFPTLTFLSPKWSQGFTSVKVDDKSKRKKAQMRDVDKLANALVTTAEMRRAADMIIVVEDLELVNLDQKEKVVGYFGEAVENHIQAHNTTPKVRNKLKKIVLFISWYRCLKLTFLEIKWMKPIQMF